MSTVMQILLLVLVVAQVPVLFYFVFPAVQYLLHLIGIRKQYRPKADQQHFSFAAIITAHKDTRFLPPFIDSLNKQTYPHFKAYIVADDCDISAITHLQNEAVTILRPQTPLHSKTSSIRFAIDHFDLSHDVIVIFDADNLLHPTYFEHLNRYFVAGFQAVQTHMLSKNIGSGIARVDSLGHIYNTFTERSSKMELGFHSAILGLGIAVRSGIYKQLVYNTKLGGFDKILQVHLAKSTRQIGFAQDCIVYDEKVESGEALEKQRTRWIFTYFKYLHLGFSLVWHGVQKLRPGAFLLGTSMVRPPLFILVALALLLTVLNFVLLPLLQWVWPISLGVFFLTYTAIIATESKQQGMLAAMLFIPAMVIRQVKALLKIKTATKDFLQTRHEHVIYIDEILEREQPIRIEQ